MGLIVTFERVYLDSNVFIRAFEGSLDDQIAQDLLGLFGLSGSKPTPVFVTSQITLAEVLVHPFKSHDIPRQLQYKLLLSKSSTWLEVVPVRQSILVAAAQRRAQIRLKLPDAIHAATAAFSGCSHIVTGDRDFGAESLDLVTETIETLWAWLRP